MSISFDGREFSEPVKLNEWKAPYRPGVYAVLIHPDDDKNNCFKPIYFGETENISDTQYFLDLSEFNGWLQKAKSLDNLFISSYLMHKSTSDKRIILKSRLSEQFLF